ncbi:MAG: M20/M25/M40 family metallo-hydrolase [Theionarchaea archaeon]|nr:M20/M25/M40 family metallo-hydrolase [Theionarchaea archaeon]MBU7039090.1 M20/M25/M40 family metallo-hydrolase [Theionarchaea archaeon]
MRKIIPAFLAVAALFTLCILLLYPHQSEFDVSEEVRVEAALKHLEALVACAPRLTGSGTTTDETIGGCTSASTYIADTLKGYGYTVEIQEFTISTSQITEYELLVDFDGDLSTPDQINLTDRAIPPMGIETDGYSQVAPLQLVEASAYEEPADEGVYLVYSEHEPAFSPYQETFFSISYQDYLLVNQERTEESVVYVNFSSYRKDVKGYNVIGIKPGSGRTVLLSAHYDSVFTDGVIDNGSGVAALLECARILSDKQTTATVYFAFFDAEEIGLLGSGAFVETHSLPHCVGINVDCIGSGNTVCVGETPRYPDMWNPELRTNYYIDQYVSSLASEVLGYTPQRLHLEDTGGVSDFVSFTEAGIPTTDITTVDEKNLLRPVISEVYTGESDFFKKRGGHTLYYHRKRFGKVVPYIHTGHDDLEHFDQQIFKDATQVVVKAAYQLSCYSQEDMWLLIVSFSGMAAALGYIVWYVKSVVDTGSNGE